MKENVLGRVIIRDFTEPTKFCIISSKGGYSGFVVPG